jgi:uncharacterized protein
MVSNIAFSTFYVIRIVFAFALTTLAGTLFSTPAFAEKRAFLVGINDYKHAPKLGKAVDDVKALAGVLQKLGFNSPVAILNTDRKTLNGQWLAFLQTVNEGDVVVVHFAGHGVQLPGSTTNYLLPADFDPNETLDFMRAQALSHPGMIDQLEQRKAGFSLWLLDACRDDPFGQETSMAEAGGASKSVSPTRQVVADQEGLAATILRERGGTFVLYSAGIGEKALDILIENESELNSLFMRHLLPLVAEPGLTITTMAEKVRDLVAKDALDKRVWKGKKIPHNQRPAFYNGVGRNVCLAGPGAHGCGETINPPVWQALANEPPTHECDRLAANPRDPDRKAEGVPYSQLTPEATRQCRRAIAQYGLHPRFEVQLARALAREAVLEERRLGQKNPDIQQKFDEAIIAMARRAEQRDARAAAFLASSYYDGNGVETDHSRASAYARIAAEAGHPVGMAMLGYNYAVGLGGLEQNDDMALSWMRRAADLNDNHALANLGWLTEGGRAGLPKGDDANRKARELYEKAANLGSGLGMANLGYLYEVGRFGIEKSEAQARAWYEKSAALENGLGLVKLGQLMAAGKAGFIKGPESDKRAVALFQLAAMSHYGRALHHLGLMHEAGRGGLKQDWSAALELQRRAHEAGEPLGTHALGWHLQAGRGVSKSAENDAKAVQLLLMSEAKGVAASTNLLGWLHQEGRGGLPKDDSLARERYQKAAAADESWAAVNLGQFHHDARGGLTKNVDEAMRLFKKAAEEGNSEGMYRLASLHSSRSRAGNDADAQTAKFWIAKSADAGHGRAIAVMGGYAYARGDFDGAADLYLQAFLAGAAVAPPDDSALTKAVQQALKKKGVYDGPIDGVQGAKIDEAFKRLGKKVGG